MESVWKGDSVFYYVKTFLCFTHILPWMSDLNLISYLAIFYLCVFIVAMTILAFAYVSYSLTRVKTSF